MNPVVSVNGCVIAESTEMLNNTNTTGTHIHKNKPKAFKLYTYIRKTDCLRVTLRKNGCKIIYMMIEVN
jgi:hypothetical protein